MTAPATTPVDSARILAAVDELANAGDTARLRAVRDQLKAAVNLRLAASNTHWRPQPKQRRATELAGQADELLYGGSRGGGKTRWLIEYMAAYCEKYPGIRVAIYRREFPSLQETVIPRAKQILVQTGRAYSREGNPTTFTFPNGSVMVCRSVISQKKVDALRGAEYAIAGFEELTEFDKSQYEELRGSVRTTIPGVRPHTIATTNPGGKGHRWVKRRFVRPKAEDTADGRTPEPGRVWRPRPTLAEPNPGTRCFLPATLADNPRLMEVDPGYRDRLNAISDPGLRKAMVDGDWDAIDAVQGALWSQEHLDAYRVWEIPVPVSRRVVSIDPSDGLDDGDGYGVAVCARGVDRVGYVERAMEWRGQPGELAERSLELYRDVRADSIVIERNHGGKWVPAMLYKIDPTAVVTTVWASEGKRTRAEPVSSLFHPNPLRSPAVLARLVGEHEDLEAELTSFTGGDGEKSPNRLDAVVWGMHELVVRGGVARLSRPTGSLRR